MTAPTGAKILPFYLVVDVSASMSGKKLASANQIMPDVVDAIARDPILSDKVRFGVIDFADQARVVMPLCDVLDEHLTLPTLSTRGSTSFAGALRLLRDEIEANIKQLKADGFEVHRPAAFFLSDGMPNNDDWPEAFRELTEWDKETGIGFRSYPNLIPCGVDSADGSVLSELIHPASGSKPMQMYLMDKGGNPAQAIGAIAEILISSILQSGHSMAEGGSGIMLPPKADLPAGITAYDPDDFM